MTNGRSMDGGLNSKMLKGQSTDGGLTHRCAYVNCSCIDPTTTYMLFVLN